MTDEKPLHVQVAEALGVKPRRSWAVMNRAEDAYFIDFDREYEAEADVADHLRRYPNGLYAQEGAHVVEQLHYPFFDTDWAATGPRLERLRAEGWNVVLQCENGGHWYAYYSDIGHNAPYVQVEGRGDTPLVAVCRLILALSAAGRLPRP